MRGGTHRLRASRPVCSFGFSVWLLALAVWLTCVSSADAREIQVKGRAYVDLANIGARFGMKAYWLSGNTTVRLKSQWTTIDIDKNSRNLKINGLPVILGFPTEMSGGRLHISKADYQHVLQSILTPQAFGKPPNLKRIVIDAGHGGHDSGARNDAYGLQEKDLTLDVSRRLKQMLERAGYEVVMTRDSDIYIPLKQRPDVANRANADLFLSLHFNAAGSATAHGFESFALTPQYQASSKFPKPESRDNVAYEGNKQDPWNALISYHVQRSLVKRLGGPDRGLKRARFLVLKHLDCPGVLVELGFVTNPSTAQKLRTATFRQTLAQSLFEGINDYQKRLQRIQ